MTGMDWFTLCMATKHKSEVVVLVVVNNRLAPFSNESFLGGNLDKEELGNALLNLVTTEDAYRKAQLRNDDADVRRQAEKLLGFLRTKLGHTAEVLRSHYDNMVTGKVIFLLHPMLRASAQSLLDVINERWRNSFGKPKFTLLEVMNSEAPLTTFIKMMIISRNATNITGTTGIMPVSDTTGGMYGTLGDRISNGSANYQQKTYGKTIQVQTRPSVSNMVVTSNEYNQGLWYFAYLEKNGRGGLSLITELNSMSSSRLRESYGGYGDEDALGGGRNSEYYFIGGGGSRSLYYDSANDAYRDRSSIRAYNIDHSKTLRATKPIETLKSAMERLPVGGYGGILMRGGGNRVILHNQYYQDGDYDGYDPNIISYRDKTGKLKFVKRKILYDGSAIENFYNTGEVGSYAVTIKDIQTGFFSR